MAEAGIKRNPICLVQRCKNQKSSKGRCVTNVCGEDGLMMMTTTVTFLLSATGTVLNSSFKVDVAGLWNVCMLVSNFTDVLRDVRRKNTTEQTRASARCASALIRRYDRVPLAAPIRLSRWSLCVGSIKTNWPCWINAVV